MKTAFTAFALAAATIASGATSASAIRPCEPLEISCHRTCTLPQTDRGIKNIYFNQC